MVRIHDTLPLAHKLGKNCEGVQANLMAVAPGVSARLLTIVTNVQVGTLQVARVLEVVDKKVLKTFGQLAVRVQVPPRVRKKHEMEFPYLNGDGFLKSFLKL